MNFISNPRAFHQVKSLNGYPYRSLSCRQHTMPSWPNPMQALVPSHNNAGTTRQSHALASSPRRARRPIKPRITFLGAVPQAARGARTAQRSLDCRLEQRRQRTHERRPCSRVRIPIHEGGGCQTSSIPRSRALDPAAQHPARRDHRTGHPTNRPLSSRTTATPKISCHSTRKSTPAMVSPLGLRVRIHTPRRTHRTRPSRPCTTRRR